LLALLPRSGATSAPYFIPTSQQRDCGYRRVKESALFLCFFFFSFRGINQNTEQWRRKYTKILNAFNIKASGIETQTSKNPAAQDHQQNATRRATAATSAEACGACKKRQLHENATQNQQNFRIERWEFFDKTLCFLLKSFQFCFLVPSQMV